MHPPEQAAGTVPRLTKSQLANVDTFDIGAQQAYTRPLKTS